MGQMETKPGRVRRFHDDGTAPADGQVFVFGSNLSGRHAGGAARAAADLYGAADGISEGLFGRTYALPIVQADLAGPLPLEAVAEAVARFLAFAQANPDTSFHVTRVGCGIAGFTDEQIAPLFAAAPDNCSLPKPWESFVGITTFKGFSRSWTCHGDFQFEPGKTYEHEGVVEACGGGFHACEYPLDVFAYYSPADSRFALVEQSGVLSRHDADSKVASQRISIKAELTIPGLISAAFEYVKSRCTPATSEHVTGYSSASSATGYSSASSATGYSSASSATGDSSASSATGYSSASLATGSYSSSEIKPADDGAPQHATAIATGLGGRVRAPEGCALVLVERSDIGALLNAWAGIAGRDGIKPDTWYTLQGGLPVEVAQ